MRQCSQCKALDRELLTDGGEPEHFVKPEIRWADTLDTKAQGRLEKQGWKVRVFQGRQAMERMVCVECLRGNEERDQIWGEMRAAAKKLEASPAAAMDGYYQNLCEV